MQKQTGSVLLILGTCIGAAMIALPVATATMSFSLTVLLLVMAWAVMTIGAWTLLRVNLWFPAGSNLITMTRRSLGGSAAVVTWIVYLLLLYSLICAYLAGGSDLVGTLFSSLDFHVALYQSALITTIVLGGIVYTGIGSVDYLNRALMSVKLAVFAVVVFLLLPHMHLAPLQQGHFTTTGSTFMIMITSFGYAIILPSIRQYLNSDRKQLKRVVWIGSVLPLLLYVIWIAVVQGVLPRYGFHGLNAMSASPHTNTMLMRAIVLVTGHNVASFFGGVFISICALTSFLGVSVALMDFLADGLGLKRQGWQGVWLFLLTYVPPLCVVIIAPQVFTIALTYAGIFSVYVLIILPLALYWGARRKNLDIVVP